jgi:hypothetical protein
MLDSTVWQQPADCRCVWITLLAEMDEDGFARFGNVKALAHRARVSEEACQEAVMYFESPEPDSSHDDDDGRRIERVPGGWMILNRKKYADIVRRVDAKEATRLRVQRHRDRKRKEAGVTPSNAVLRNVTPSDSDTDTDKTQTVVTTTDVEPEGSTAFGDPVKRVFKHWQDRYNHPQANLDAKRRRVIGAAIKHYDEATVIAAIDGYASSPHHMGENDRHTIYDDISLFLRDSKHIEVGLKFAQAPPIRLGSALTRKNTEEAAGWQAPGESNDAAS